MREADGSVEVWGPQEASVEVFTFREGMLAAVGHDLRFAAQDFELRWEARASRFSARVDAASLEVICARRMGHDDFTALSAADKAQILRSTCRDVLEVERFPDIRFDADRVDATGMHGQLTLHGVTRPLEFRHRVEGGRRVADVSLDQRNFGIKPFVGLLGALKVKAEVQVRVSLPMG